jgi:hypothetical protein
MAVGGVEVGTTHDGLAVCCACCPEWATVHQNPPFTGKSAGERVSVLTKAMKRRRGDCRLTVSPSTLRLDASARVLLLLEMPPILTLLYVIEKSVLESKVDLQMLITC